MQNRPVDGPTLSVDESSPSDRLRLEVGRILDEDQTRLGEVYRLDVQGKSAQEIAEELSLDTSGFVSNYKAIIAALLDGDLPNSPTLAAQVAARVRTWLKKADLSPDVRSRLNELHTALQDRSEDPIARSLEESRAKQRTDEVEQSRTPGIYVYTLPHYLRYPYDPDSGRTLLKVGRSERDTFERAYNQGRITALPEDPIILRVYRVPEGQTAAVERHFQDGLTAADHERSRSLRGGSEWFLTSTKFLDWIARSKGFDVEVVTEFETGD